MLLFLQREAILSSVIYFTNIYSVYFIAYLFIYLQGLSSLHSRSRWENNQEPSIVVWFPPHSVYKFVLFGVGDGEELNADRMLILWQTNKSTAPRLIW